MHSAAKKPKLCHRQWKTGECSYCGILLDNRSRLLMCLHGICGDCVVTETLDLGVPCNICKTVTEGKLVDFPVSTIKFKICSNLTCSKESKVNCILCSKTLCNSCSLEHKNINDEHQNYMDKNNINIFHNLKCTFDRCKNCHERAVEVMCTSCSTIQCALCQLNYHEGHVYESLEEMTKEAKSTLNLKKNDLLLNMAYIDQCMALILVQSRELDEKCLASKSQIMKLIDRMCKEVHHRGQKLILLIDQHYKKQAAMIKKNAGTLENLKNKNKYYKDFMTSILEYDTCLYDAKLAKIIMDKLTSVRTCIAPNTPQLVLDMKPNITFSYDTCEELLQNIKSVGRISSPTILDLSCVVDQETPLVKTKNEGTMEGENSNSDPQ